MIVVADRRTAIAAWVALALLLAVGVAIRLAALDAPGHYGDAFINGRWTDNMAEYGPWDFYRHDNALYSALLYAYWPIGVLLDGAAQARAIKGLSIPFDLAIAIVAYLAARRMVGPIRALVAPALYLLNPAVLLAGPVWGQVDAAGTLAYLLALLALAGRRLGLAGACAVLALLTKPQFGLVLLPVAMVAILSWRSTRSLSPLVRSVLGGAAAYAVVAVPLRMDPISFLDRVISAGSFKEMSSANAANLWGLFHGYKIPDGGLVYVGAVLLLLGVTAALLPLLHRRDLPMILAVGAFVIFAFYFLPTRVHERYLFPAMAVLAPLAAASWRVSAAYLLLTAAFAASMIYALVDTTPFTFWPWVEDLFAGPVGRVGIPLTMIGAAATLVWLLMRRYGQYAASFFGRHVGLLGLIGLLAVGLAIRLALLEWPGHGGDTQITARWAEGMARYGPWGFYDHDVADYQALLYVFWPLGALFDGDGLVRAVKSLSIPFDMALGVVLYLVALRFTQAPRALLAPALYLLNPAVLLAGPVWGQVDAAGTLAFLVALLAVAAARYPAAGALAVLSMLIKPQAGLVALPVMVVAFIRGRAAGTVSPLVRVAIGAVVAYVMVAGPLRLDPIRFVERVMTVGALKPSTSLNAPNLWGTLIGYKLPDGPLFWIGAVLLLVGLLAAMLPLRRRQDLRTILTVGVFVVFAFYFLPTRVHERYLFPVMALLAPMAAANWRVLGGYLIMTAAFTVTILYALISTTPFELPRLMEQLLSSRTIAIWIGLTLMATAATLAFILLTEPPEEPTKP